jgi:hypothetical protein
MDEPKPNLANGAAPAFLPRERGQSGTGSRPSWWPRTGWRLKIRISSRPGAGYSPRGWKYAAWADRDETLGVSAFLGGAIKCFGRAAMILGRFGVTPSERSKIHLGHDADRDPVEAYRAKPSRRPTP